MAITPERRASLLTLLEDPSPVVQTALLDEFRRHGRAAIEMLRGVLEQPDSDLAGFARDYLKELDEDSPVEAFRDFIQSCRYELETGFLLLNRSHYPDVDIVKARAFLDELAARCKQLMLFPSTAWEKCRVINRVLFHEYGFAGDTEHFYNPDNSFLHKVIERRRGIPISLSILYLLVADRCNLELEPIGAPGRFLVGCFLDGEPFYIDAFEKGVFLTLEDVEARLAQNNLEMDPAYFTPTAVGDVIRRCCQNLVHQFTEAHDLENARLYSDFINEFETVYRRHL